MTILWPAGLPDFLLEGYSRTREDNLIRSQFPGGTKTRPRFTKPLPRRVNVQLDCNQAQLQTLDDFWEITCKQGTLTFWYRDLMKPDPTLVEYEFLAPPSDALVPNTRGRVIRVSLQLAQLTTYQGTFPLDVAPLST